MKNFILYATITSCIMLVGTSPNDVSSILNKGLWNKKHAIPYFFKKNKVTQVNYEYVTLVGYHGGKWHILGHCASSCCFLDQIIE